VFDGRTRVKQSLHQLVLHAGPSGWTLVATRPSVVVPPYSSATALTSARPSAGSSILQPRFWGLLAIILNAVGADANEEACSDALVLSALDQLWAFAKQPREHNNITGDDRFHSRFEE